MAEADNVFMTLQPVGKGDVIGGMQVRDDIPAGHKVAAVDISGGCPILKYGVSIGVATEDILAGSYVHTHNMESAIQLGEGYAYDPQTELCCTAIDETGFMGYKRSHGGVGIRNQLWIIPTVGCINALAQRLARDINCELTLDGDHEALALTHPFGCSQQGGDHALTRKLLARLARHPNAGGILILSLGCENNTLPEFLQELGEYPRARLRSLTVQAVSDEYELGMEALRSLAEKTLQDARVRCPWSDLIVGLKCGGSDAFSGLTANPLVGEVANLLAQKGTAFVMGEVPEMFGGEQIILNRCANKSLFLKGQSVIEAYKEYFTRQGCPLGANPSPGNKEGGITTLEEKSLGCIQKAGKVPITAILDKGEPCVTSGLSLLNGPGNDAIAITLLAAAGCQLILFTTGRGTPLGSIVPTVKIASNTPLAELKKHWIDFDAGVLVSAGYSMEELAQDLLQRVSQIVSGEQTKNELSDCREISLFKDGVIL